MSTDNKEEEKEAVSITVSVPEELKRQFKIYCIERGLTMTDALREILRQVLVQS